MHPRLAFASLSLLLAALSLYIIGRGQFIASAQVTAGDSALALEIFNRTNQLRLQVGAQPLRFSETLALAAYDQAAYQVANVWWGHIRPDGSTPADRATRAGYANAIRCCGENYYMSIDATVDLVWNFWINSPDHYANLTSPWYNDLGVAMATDGYRKGYVMVFGVGPALPAAPVVTLDPSIATGMTMGEMTYVVQRGDTMQAIARAHGVTIEAIARANGIANPDRIMPGDVLTIPVVLPVTAEGIDSTPTSTPVPTLALPAPAATAALITHTVARGETLYRIAIRYGTTVAALAAANGISDPTRIYPGQVLVIVRTG
jgi:LysM repeat protein